jgi:dTDP-4-amino-4,6-dideoxygalactose transaminase
LFPVLVDSSLKTHFMRYLRSNGIACGEHYPVPIPAQEALADAEHEVIGDCAAATRIAQSEVSLPIHPYLDSDEVARVIAASNTWSGTADCASEETIRCSRS